LNLEREFLQAKFPNPLVLASGVLGVTGKLLAEAVNQGAGGVITKSIWLKSNKGHANPVIFADKHMMINAVGLSDAGIEKAKQEIEEYRRLTSLPLIANIVAVKIADFAEITERVSEINPDIIEVNISCPNVEEDHGKPFACDLPSAAQVVKTVRKNTNKPITIKLSPNVINISEIAKACEDAGADAITAINTVGPGMRINLELKAPILKNKAGGISGPAILPIAIKAVNDIRKAVKLPILGIGGVTSGRDAIELMMAGASLIGLGTAVHFRGIDVFRKICQEIEEWCEENKVSTLDEIIGII
jgi:dihydroorotate dehydrogenase (NAD+) catalytic subunit